jgi:hypothetical protein
MSRRRSSGIALALLSFVIYACTIFVLPQVQDARYCCEQSSIAAAFSNIMYGTPLGSLYSSVFDYFVERLNEPLERTLEQAQTPGAGLPVSPAGELFKTTRDGNGIGYPLVATAAFRLFGMHAWGLMLTMLILMAVSAAAFLVRFSGAAFAVIVTLYFSALTVMLFTPLVWDPPFAINITVGGIRYFSLIAVLPLFHILFELVHSRATLPALRRRNVMLLGLQTAILVLAILVRGSALSLIGAIALVWLALAWRHGREPGRLRMLCGNLAVMVLVSVAALAAIAASVPRDYLIEGRFGTVIWQRVTESLGVNPAWPFAGVNDMFDCKGYLPKGFLIGPDDNNGICIWLDYVYKHDIPIDTIGDKTFGTRYETALREAFFKVAARYPGEVLKTFLYYKPLFIISSIAYSMRFNFEGDQAMSARALPADRPMIVAYPPAARWLLLVSLAIALVSFIVGPTGMPELRQIAGVTLLSALFTAPPYLAAWAQPHTSGDLLLYCLFTIGLATGATLIWVWSALRGRTMLMALVAYFWANAAVMAGAIVLLQKF